jgi:Grx4 family monothiol glutaredoxin
METSGSPSNEVTVSADAEFETRVKASTGLVVVYFWASWHEPCVQITTVISTLAREHKNVVFLKLDAEALPETAERFNVQSVPTTIFILGNAVVARQEGANVPDLVAVVMRLAARAALTQVGDGKARVSDELAGALSDAMRARLATLVASCPVMLFMKGAPGNPKCGFSRQAAELLTTQGAVFGYFDILTDTEVREGLKLFSDWKTYPQIYIKGKLIGGLDVLKELVNDGEFQALLPAPSQTAPGEAESLEARMQRLIDSHPVMLFMKGGPDSPKCGNNILCYWTVHDIVYMEKIR